MSFDSTGFQMKDKALVGMVHVQALPGTPGNRLAVREIVEAAVAEAALLEKTGFDAIIVENMHDRPYLLRHVGSEIVAAMTVVVQAVRQAVDVPLGVQILAGANTHALAVAHASDASFIRAEGFVFAQVSDEGLMDTADAAKLLRYRRLIGADEIAVIADIKKKHSSHAITADVGLAETAKAAEFFGADGVIVTGVSTGSPANPDEVLAASQAVRLPTYVGSGVTPENLPSLWNCAAGFIVGSYIKRDGIWSNPLDISRISRLMESADQLRNEDASV